MKVRLETDFPDRFARLKQVCLRHPDGSGKLYLIVATRAHKGQILLRLEGVASIDEVELLRNRLVQIRGQEAVRLPANEFYIHDLIGCEVVTSAGRVLGPLTQVLRGVANDVYVIGSGKREILLPVIREVVQEVDMVGRRITVTPTPGLLPEESEESGEQT
jgi:16S rRNA processing protein RimM